MNITKDEVEAFAHCAQQVTDGELTYTHDGWPEGSDRCPGFQQERVRAIRETIQWTYLDLGADPNDPMDVHKVERSVDRLEFADPADAPCPHCQHPRELSEQLRPRYPRLSERGPEAIFEMRRQERQKTQAQRATANAAERQADALEHANVLEERRIAAMEEENRLRRIELGLDGNGHEQRPSDVAPRPRKRSSA